MTLVGCSTVLTVAQCFRNKRTWRWLYPKLMHFMVAYRLSNYLAESKVKSYCLSNLELPNFKVTYIDFTKDWAFKELEVPFCSIIGYLSIIALKCRETVRAGYSKGKPHLLTMNKKCFIEGKREWVFFQDFNATFSDADSPILLREGDKTCVGADNAAVSSSMKGARKLIGIVIFLPEGALKK